MELINIKEFCADWKAKLKEITARLSQEPTLSIYQVGENEASSRYVRNKIKDCNEVGIRATLHLLDENITTDELMIMLWEDAADGVIVQLPLPEHIDIKRITRAIPVEKDVDGFKGEESPYMCCTPGGIIKYLDACGFRYDGANAVIIGRSKIVGRPMAKYLLDRNCTVTICHSRTNKSYLYTLLNWADLVVCAVGKHGIIKTSQVDPKTIVIDVGINFDKNGKLVGDVINDDFSSLVTPVPGGVGLLTRCQLLENTILAAKRV